MTSSATLTVQQTAVQVVVSPGTAIITSLGGTQLFTAEALDANDNPMAGASFTWSSSDPTVAAIDPSTGIATAVADGSTTITASSGALSGTAALDVVISTVTVARITVTPLSATLTSLGDQQQFLAVARDANGNVLSGATITWSSSNVASASIDPVTGIASALGNGATTISATSGPATGSAELLVEQVAASVTVAPATATLHSLGETQQFTAVVRDANGNVVTAAPLTWSTSDLATASVDAATGLATAHDNGSTTITATSGAATGSAELLVEQVAASITVTPASVTLSALGDTVRFGAVALDARGNAISSAVFAWSSSDPTRVTIDPASGLATAVDDGS